MDNSTAPSRLLDVVFSDRHYIRKIKGLAELLRYINQHPWLPHENIFMLIRPRGFGLTMAMEALGSILMRDDLLIDHLTDLEQNDFSQSELTTLPEYPVISLSFMKLIANDPDELSQALLDQIQKQFWEHHVKSKLNTSSYDLKRCLYQLILELYNRQHKPVVILIDGFDAPIISISRMDKQEQDEALSIYLDMLNAIRQTDSMVKFSLLSGHIKFALSSQYSNGLPHVVDLSYHPLVSTLFGFTLDEVKTCYADELSRIAPQRGVTVNEYLTALNNSYGGFVFSDDITQTVLNPSSVIKALNHDGEMYTYAADSDFGFLEQALLDEDPDLDWLFNKAGQDALFLENVPLHPKGKDFGALLSQLGFVAINNINVSEHDFSMSWQYRFDVPNVEMRRLLKIVMGKASLELKDLIINERVSEANEDLYDLEEETKKKKQS